MSILISGTTLTFNDATTQTTSGTVTTFGAVGTYAFVGNFSTGVLKPGDTIAGSSLTYVSGTVLSAGASAAPTYSITYVSGYTPTGSGQLQVFNNGSWSRAGSTYNGTNFSDVLPTGISTFSGTWKIMGGVAYPRSYRTSIDGDGYTDTNHSIAGCLALRIS